MNKIKTVKIRNEDGSVSEESYSISVDARNVDMDNGKDLQYTVGEIDVDSDGNIAEQLKKTIHKSDIIDNLTTADAEKVLSANQGKVLNEAVTALDLNVKEKPYYFDTYNDMISKASTFKSGMKLKTLGYHFINDGGAAEYIVTNVQNDTKYQVNIGTNLWLEMIIKDSVNVKQFGAYGDGETDDVQYIQNAINSNAKIIDFLDKTYVIKNTLTFKSKRYTGENATIILETQPEFREHVIRNENYGNLNAMDNIEIENLIFINNSNETAFGFSCSKVVVENCEFYGYKLNTHGMLDFYANNSNSVVKDCYFKIEVENPSERGGPIEIRGFHGGITKHFLVSNCYFEQNSKDECFFINARECPIEDVIVENCIIKSTGTNANAIWISNASSNGQSTYIKNITLKNNTIIHNKIQDRLITVAKTEHPEYQSVLDVKNINIENNIIIINDQESTHNKVIEYGYNDSEPELVVKNNRFIYNGTTRKIEFILVGKIRSYNNIFEMSQAENIYRGCYEINGDTITNCEHLGRNLNTIMNINAKCNSSALYDNPDEKYYNTTKLMNSNLICNNLITNASGNIGRVYEISNNTINNTSHLYNNYNGDNTNILKLNNNIISNINYVNNVSCQLYLGMNYKDTGELISGIPTQSLVRESCIVGTILFSNTAGKSIVRKINSGSATTDWEEL